MDQDTRITPDDVVSVFPELGWFEDADLRGRCIAALVEGYNRGGWSKGTMDRCPVSLRVQDPSVKSQIDHVHAVTRIALSIYDTLEEVFHRDSGLRDLILAGALLHDVGKLTEFTLKDGKPVHSQNAELIRHPLGGAILAAQAGLPDEVVHIIATHSFEGRESYKTVASTIIKMADDATFSYTLFQDSAMKAESK